MSYATRNTQPYGISLRALPRLAWNVAEYALFRRGLLSSNVLEAAAYVRTNPNLRRPDIQFSFMSGKRGSSPRKGSPSTQFGYGHGYGLTAILLRPESRGSISLAGPGPADPPAIDPCFIAAERDLDVLLRGLKLGRRILAAPAFGRFEGRELAPGPGIGGDDDLREYIRETCGAAFHPVGTCAMGTGGKSVVDPRLAVHGLEQFRIIDASVMPTIPGGNTNAPTIMIAEKGSDLILGRAPPPPAALQP